MPTEFTLPNLGENIESVRIAALTVKVGDTVAADQTVLELETDKAMMELPAPTAGTIQELFVQEGQDIEIGQKLMIIDGTATGATTDDAETEPKPAPETEETPGEAPVAAADAAPAPAPAPQPTPRAAPAPAAPAGAKVPASPSVRRFAREIGIDIVAVPGTGDHGRISVEDVKAYAKQLNTGRTAAPAGPAQQGLPPLPDFTRWGGVTREHMSPIRLKTARQMQLCWSQIPHVTQFNEADVTELEKLRKRYAKKAETIGGKLTMAVMVVKVVASALKMFPKFNASLDMDAKEVLFKDFINIGIAVSTERGLLVPVLRDVDKKNMVDISAEIIEIAGKARTGKVTLDDLSGGTFTITNLGGIGGTFFTPIINHPEVAILGMGRSYLKADHTGESEPRMMLPLSLSYDHRLIDGADGATFLKWVVDAIEEPLLLSLEG
jgi:pyruvate dehydrogenase E2 component (dihydrolipoamide acetyltransferase)